MRKPRSKNLVIFLLCFVLLALFEPFGYTSAYADVQTVDKVLGILPRIFL